MEWNEIGVIALGSGFLLREAISGMLRLRKNDKVHTPPCDDLKELRHDHNNRIMQNRDMLSEIKADIREIKTDLKYLIKNNKNTNEVS